MKKALKKVRANEWWKPKAGFLFALLFFSSWLAEDQITIVPFLKLFFLSFITLTAIGILGHFLNDLGDLETDAKAGKSNGMQSFSQITRILLLVLAFVIAALPWFYLPVTSVSVILFAIELILLLIYPLKPFRLKQYPVAGIIADAFYAFAIPSVLAFYTYHLFYNIEYNSVSFIVLFIWSFAIGIRQIIYHHVADRKNDLKSGTPNIALSFSSIQLDRFLTRFIILVELISGVLFLLLFRTKDVFFIYPLLAAYVCFFFPLVTLSPIKIFPQHLFGVFNSDKFYSHYWSIITLVVLSFYKPAFVIVLILILSVFTSFKSHFFVRYVIYDLLKKNARDFAAYTVNYSIYYFRKFVLMKGEKGSRAEFYDEWNNEQTLKKKGVIALMNANRNKYTETFVREHEKLPFFMHYYFGADFPVWHHRDGNLISNNETLLKTKNVINLWLQREKEDVYLNTVAKHLLINEVQLVLCEFGTTAAKLARIPELTGIPLIAIFYGYDAHHEKTVKQNLEKYQELFLNASLIIGVSQDILAKLKILGAPEEKLIYLPCSFDVNLFQYSDHSVNNPVFLAVGRFAETKAPHLTILSFNEVQKRVPDAQLIMVGKDGGGELFEACHILAKALGIEKKISFKGILNSEQVFEEMKSAYCFVQHSLTTPIQGDKEGTPVAIVEAMSCGLPVIATRHAGIAEIIEHEKNGILVEEYDYMKMAAEMLRVIENKQLAKELGYSASESIKNNPLFLANKELLTEIIERYKLK